MIDLTTLEHTLIALICLGVGFLCGDIYAGASFACGGFLFRVITQAEYRYIDLRCGGVRANMPWYAPFLISSWNLHSILDFLVPAIVVVICISIIHYFI